MPIVDRSPPRRNGWTTTRWSIVSTLAQRDDQAWEPSWTYLVETYRGPMEAYVRGTLRRIRRRTPAPDEVQDVVQDFLSKCLEKDWLARADADKGSFRVYVRFLLSRFARKHVSHQTARKRSPGQGRVFVDLLEHDAVDERRPEEEAALAEFDRGWVMSAVRRALARLAETHARYHVIIVDLLLTHGEGSADLAERLETKPEQLPVLRFRARRRFRDLLVEELRATVKDEAVFQEEWRVLAPYLP